MLQLRPKAAFLLGFEHWDDIYGRALTSDIGRRVELLFDPSDRCELAVPASGHSAAEVLFSGWGTPPLTVDVLNCMPALRAIFNGGGSIRPFITDEVWRRGIRVTSAHRANAIPVSEYVVSMILLSLKSVFYHARKLRETHLWPGWPVRSGITGAYGATVGLVSLGTIGRLVAQQLRQHDINVIAHDPWVSPDEGLRQGITMVSLQKLFESAEIVSLHTPLLTSTRGLIGGELLARLKPAATFINTARGEVVNEQEMIDVLRARPDLQAILDVTSPEPPSRGSALYDLPNIILTPHLAGSLGNECRRHGRIMLEELDRYLAGEPLACEITRQRANLMA